MMANFSDTPPYTKAIERLDSRTRRVVLSLLAHPIVQRLQEIQQLGFTSRVFAEAVHTRWEHTLWTVNALCHLLESAPLSSDIRCHLLASSILQDVGHSPYSNSLGSIFARKLVDALPLRTIAPDKLRTILILEH